MKKAKDIKPSDIVFNSGQKFVVKEVRVNERDGWIMFLTLKASGTVHITRTNT
jgi:hypothetical protein